MWGGHGCPTFPAPEPLPMPVTYRTAVWQTEHAARRASRGTSDSCVHTGVCVCMSACPCVCACAPARVRLPVYMCACAQAPVCVRLPVYVCASTCVHACVRVPTYVDPVGPLGGRGFNCQDPNPTGSFSEGQVCKCGCAWHKVGLPGQPPRLAEGHRSTTAPPAPQLHTFQEQRLRQRGDCSFALRRHFLACDIWGPRGRRGK